MNAKERAVKMWNDSHGMSIEEMLQALEHNVVEAVAEEREACATIASDWGSRQPVTTADKHIPGADHGERYASAGIADAIRARNEN